MRKVRNPFVELEGYGCFACCPGHPHGLRMEFHEDGADIISVWNPDPGFQGFSSVLHGGIQATALDEVG